MRQRTVIYGAIFVILCGSGRFIYQQVFATAPPRELIRTAESARRSKTPEIYCHISGAVNNEGVFKINPGDRIIDLIALAGGARPEADLSALNLAEEVKDGQKVKVPARRTGQIGHTRQISEGSINLNTAGLEELTSLKGIGKATAERIIEYRQKNGPFKKPEDLTKVSRIGQKMFERLKDKLVI